MGQYITRYMSEVEEVNEGHSTPKQHTHKLPDGEDPRSPTTEIHRTPIEVEDTPTKSGSTSDNSQLGQSPTSSRPQRMRSVPESLHKKTLQRNALAPRNEFAKSDNISPVEKCPLISNETENNQISTSS